MIINANGITQATQDELLEVWLHDRDLFKLLDFCEFVLWCKIAGTVVV